MGLLAPLTVGSEIPWRLTPEGEPQWLTVIEVVSPGVYLVRYPDGVVEELRDTDEAATIPR